MNSLRQKYFLDPFGCAKNQVDAEIIMLSLNNASWTAVDDPSLADLIIVNSCGFIEAAKRESINAVIAWKKRYPQKKILLAGCLAQRYRAELEESLTEADGFLGCNELNSAPEKAAELFARNALKPKKTKSSVPARPFGPSFGPPLEPSRAGQQENSRGLRPLLGFPGSAYVKISEGCNNNCSFCAIPLIRGPLRCRPVSEIAGECKELLKRGVKELCLIGQDLASYNSLAALLKAIAKLRGNFWVRLLYLHPDHFPLDILDIIANDSRFLPYFDIPFQHASPQILSLMGRKGSAKTYLGLLDTIRSRLPGAVIRSTFLAGFPGETEDHFKTLLDFQKQAGFDWLGVFTFSAEEGTAAYSMKGKVSKKIAAERKALIEEKQIPITEKKMNRFVGKTMDVLVEETIFPDTKDNSDTECFWLGRLFCQAPEVDGAAVIRRSAEYDHAEAQRARKKLNNTKNVRIAPDAIVPGAMVRGKVIARSGFDLEIIV